MTKKEWLIIAGVVVTGSAIVGLVNFGSSSKDNMAGMDHSKMSMAENASGYSLKLMSGKSYLANKPVMLHFAIQDKSGKVLKDFDTVHEKKLHLIVVRKDRTNFQHVHPTLEARTGMFMIEPFTFPTDGDYRVFAESTPSSTQKDAPGNKPAAVAYQDVQVGDISAYKPQPLGSDALTSSVNGFDTKLSVAGDSPTTDFTANATTTVAVAFNKAGSSYANLQKYLGALGHMVVLGPNLEYIHAHALSEDVANQTGIIKFAVSFKDAGQYKAYLQTQADNQVNTTDYTMTAKPSSSTSSSNGESMQGMDHSGH